MRKVRKVFLPLRTFPSFPKVRNKLRKWAMAFACASVQKLASDGEMMAIGTRFQMLGMSGMMRDAMEPMLEDIEKLKGGHIPDEQVEEMIEEDERS